MTKVTPYQPKPIPIILINDQELSSFENISHANQMGMMENEASSSNDHRINAQEIFCEFKRTERIPRRGCHHITCLYKRNNQKTSFFEKQSNRNSENKEKNVLNPSLSLERHIHDEKAQRRLIKHLAILRNDNNEFSWVKIFLHSFGAVFLGLLSTFPMTLVPSHDLVKCPEYWYESLYYVTVSAIGTCFLNSCLSGYFLNIDYTLKLKNIAIISVICIVLANSTAVVTHYLWTSVLTYQYPIPFLGIALWFFMTFPLFTLMWFNFPKEWRQDNEFRMRVKYFACFWAIVLLTTIVYRAVIEAMSEYHTIVAFTSIATREIYLWIEDKVIQNTSCTDHVGAKTMLKYYIYVTYSLVTCNLLASHPSDAASWILIGADFLINILKCFRLFWVRKRSTARIMDQIDRLQDLVICELVEFQAPLSYILTYICTYYGPSGHLFGNVLNGYWSFVATEDINQKLYKWTLYFLADFSSIIVTAISLWHAFKINVFQALLDLQQEFWPGFFIVLGALLNHVSQKMHINTNLKMQ